MTPYCALYGLVNFTGEKSVMFTAIIRVSLHGKSLFYFKILFCFIFIFAETDHHEMSKF